MNRDSKAYHGGRCPVCGEPDRPTETAGASYARGWKAGWAAAMTLVRDEAGERMFDPPAPEPRLKDSSTKGNT